MKCFGTCNVTLGHEDNYKRLSMMDMIKGAKPQLFPNRYMVNFEEKCKNCQNKTACLEVKLGKIKDVDDVVFIAEETG